MTASEPIWAQNILWHHLEEGVDAGVWNPGLLCRDEVPLLVMVKIDPERVRFATYHYLDEKLPAPLTIKEWQRRTGAMVLLNAGLFRDDYSYMGLLLKNGRSVGTKRHPLWQGLFVAEPVVSGLRNARVLDLAVDPFSEDHPVYGEAAQSLMLLDRNGKSRVRQTGKRAHQTLIGEERNGRILVMKTADAASLWDLAECLHKGIPSIHQVMAMDGGASSDLLIAGHLPTETGTDTSEASLQSIQTLVDGSGMRHIPLPAVIGVLPRSMERGKGVEGYGGK
ncbi:MAG TPA: phosphodiester glycosidase family protein [Nitrospiraceae bacterium]|nr:phosphodiester glycosidase family protein [Nitrospiraceae bacterium]